MSDPPVDVMNPAAPDERPFVTPVEDNPASLMAQLLKARAERDAALSTVQWARWELAELRTSRWWRVVTRLQRWRARIVPPGSRGADWLRRSVAMDATPADAVRQASSLDGESWAQLVPGIPTIIFAPSTAWYTPLVQRTHHLARAFARADCNVIFDCTATTDDVHGLVRVDTQLFLYRGPVAPLTKLTGAVVWTLSYNAGWANAFPPSVPRVYDWIDELAIFPHGQAELRRQHGTALARSQVVLAVSRDLLEKARATRDDALYVPNAADVAHFGASPSVDVAAIDREFAAVVASGKPLAGYYGARAGWLDVTLLRGVAAARPDWAFVLIGADLDHGHSRQQLAGLPNVHVLGPRDYSMLPAYLACFDVALIPFCVDATTLGVSPLKLFEYLAGGKPVVTTPLPECRGFEGVHVAAGVPEFAAALDVARAEGRGAGHAARMRQQVFGQTWDARARQVLDALSRLSDVQGSTRHAR